MHFCMKKLASASDGSAPALSVLCGDTNIESYSEIADNFIANGYTDALVAANPPPSLTNADRGEASETAVDGDPAAEVDLFMHMPTFGQAGLKFADKVSKERIGRLDYILCRAGSINPTALPSQSSSPAQGIVENPESDGSTSPAVEIRAGSAAQTESTSGGGRLKVVKASLLGAEMIPREVVKKKGGVDDPDMRVYASDHLGVHATIQV